MNTNTTSQKKQALVIGGGIAGLISAHVLSEQYTNVLVVERDSQPDRPEPRAGTPQSFHLHQVLPSGSIILEKLFPHITDDLLALGAFPLENTLVRWTNRYGTMTLPIPDKGANYSRPLLEWALRQRVGTLPNVHFLYQREVTGLELTPDRARITGITMRQRGQLDQQTMLQADLVIDASGRFSKLPQWLEALGFILPEDECLTTSIGYATRNYRLPENRENVASVIVLENNPLLGNSAGGVLKAIEHDTWAVCLSSIGGHYPPTEASAFTEDLARLIAPIDPQLAKVFCAAEPLTEPRGYRIPACVRHHYEQMADWPAGLLVLGDALCSLDPVYGQGMTVAAIGAQTLATCLNEEAGQPRPGFERRVLQRLQEATYPAWWLSAIEDLRWPGVVHSGPAPIQGLPLLHRFFNLCLARMTRQFQPSAAGEFNPLFLNYMLMNALVVHPRDVINTNMLEAVLADRTPEEKQGILADLLQGHDQPLETVLDTLVPARSTGCALPMPEPIGTNTPQ